MSSKIVILSSYLFSRRRFMPGKVAIAAIIFSGAIPIWCARAKQPVALSAMYSPRQGQVSGYVLPWWVMSKEIQFFNWVTLE